MPKILFAFIGFTMLLTACSTSNLTFSGESENWYAQLKVQQNQDISDQHVLIRYKGKNQDSVNEVSYYVESVGLGFGSDSAELDEGGNITNGVKECFDCFEVKKDHTMKVKIKWNGLEENITLKSE